MRILCYVNHFFGKNPHFIGKSSISINTSINEFQDKANLRKQIVIDSIAQLNTLGRIEIKVCGIAGYSLVPLDITFNQIKDNPLLLIYESLNHMGSQVDNYDYFINVEDDVFIPQDTFANIVEYDKQSLLNEIILPNRLEKSPEGTLYCVDTMAIPGQTQQRQRFKNHDLRVSVNPHSAVLIFSQEKFRYALKRIDRDFRKAILHNEIDSAFAYFHSPFSLFRSEDISFHYVMHMDNWMHSDRDNGFVTQWRYRLRSLKAEDFVPPVIMRIFLFFKKKVKGSHNSI